MDEDKQPQLPDRAPDIETEENLEAVELNQEPELVVHDNWREEKGLQGAADKAYAKHTALMARLAPSLARAAQDSPDEAGFNAVLRNPDVSITESMLEAVADLPDAGQILFSIADDPSEAARIAGLPPASQRKEMRKLAAYLNGEEGLRGDTQPRGKVQASNAPEPIEGIRSGVSRDGWGKHPDRMTQAEYEHARKSGEIR